MSASNVDLLQSLFEAQSSKDSLMQSVLMGLSSSDKVIVFEGVTDYQVYDEWLKSDLVYQNAEHICAKGKSQLVDLYVHVKKINHTDIINGCKFFVDHDYDMVSYNDNCIITLGCYSVENYLVNDLAVDSILKDEFQLDVRKIAERKKILQQFREDLVIFNELAKQACLPLFIRHNREGRAFFYKKISDVIVVEYGNVRPNEHPPESVLLIRDCESAEDLENYFYSLPYVRCIRGKYHFEFIKKWLISLREKINTLDLMNLS
ncbi:DUF4435 domain-containing protein, partial [Cronobacter sakazakii]|nr:DUF4435 domain-containing protein [Cronobacter sakazakii]